MILLYITLKLIFNLFLMRFGSILLLSLILVSATISSEFIRLFIIIIISYINIILRLLVSSTTLGRSLALVYLCCSVILRKLHTCGRLVLRSDLILVFLIVIWLNLHMALSLWKDSSCRHLFGSRGWSNFLIYFSLISYP